MHRPMAPAGRTGNSGGRQVLIVVAVVLALLVLLCAGVISFLVKSNSSFVGLEGRQTAVVRAGVTGEQSPGASYRSMKQAHSLTPASEGRQTL
jgi:serine/threonine-protein kinase